MEAETKRYRHWDKVWNDLQDAKKEIEQQNKVIEMLKESQQFIMSSSQEKKATTPLDRIMSHEYGEHLQQAVIEAKALYNVTVEGSPVYHGLQSIAQSQIAIVLLLEQFVNPAGE